MLHAMVSGSSTSSAAPAPAAPFAPATAAPTAPPNQPAPPSKPAPTAVPQPTASTTHTISGPVIDDQFGQVQATITVAGAKITNVSITAPQDNPRSAFINQQAVPMLQQETLQAQSANINLISGATVTSEAYLQSLQGALQSAGLQ